MSATIKVISKEIFTHSSGVIPASQKSIVLSFPLTEESACKSLADLRELFQPIKEKLFKVIRKNWHNDFDFQQYRSIGAITTYNFVIEYQVSNIVTHFSTVSQEEFENRKSKAEQTQQESKDLIEALEKFLASCPDIF